MKKLRKAISIILCILLLPVSVTAAFNDVSGDALYYNSLERLSSLGIISKADLYYPDRTVSKEEFAKLMVAAAGLQEEADARKGSTVFPDVDPDLWSSGYINVAVQKGFVKSELDGSFKPSKNITFAQVIAAFVTQLGYTTGDLYGIWPGNYLDKADSLGLTENIGLSAGDFVPRGSIALMLDRFLNTKIKDSDKTYADASGHFINLVITGNSITDTSLKNNQVITNKGVFDHSPSLVLMPGIEYVAVVEDNIISSAYQNDRSYEKLAVKSIHGNELQCSSSLKEVVLNLPYHCEYYHGGSILKYENVAGIIQTGSSLVLAKDSGSGDCKYIAIFDPVYSSPEIAKNTNRSTYKIGSISTYGKPITKDGKIISFSGIEYNDVVYKVSDLWEYEAYILVIDNEISGDLQAILPNKISPQSVQIKDKNLNLNKSFDINTINMNGLISAGDNITALLGHDGTVVDIIHNGYMDNNNFALVLDSYSKTILSGTDYYVNLLLADGTIETFTVKEDKSVLKGKLVKLAVEEISTDDTGYDKALLEKIDFEYTKIHVIDKIEGKIDDNYVSDNVVIFNLIENIYGKNSDASVMNWSKMPDGKIELGKIKYLNKTGDFEDINVIFTDNILDEGYRLGIITDIKSSHSEKTGTVHTIKLLVGGEQYQTATTLSGIGVGSVLELRMENGKIQSVKGYNNAWAESTKVAAIDSGRIKVGSKIYRFNNDIALYFRNNDGNYTSGTIEDVDTDKEYTKVSVHLDKSHQYGGRAEIIVFR